MPRSLEPDAVIDAEFAEIKLLPAPDRPISELKRMLTRLADEKAGKCVVREIRKSNAVHPANRAGNDQAVNRCTEPTLVSNSRALPNTLAGCSGRFHLLTLAVSPAIFTGRPS